MVQRDINLRGYRLPTAEQGAEGLVGFADIFGDTDVFHFLGLMRGNQYQSILGEARAILAARMILKLMRNDSTLTYEQARRKVCLTLGYGKTTLTNFYHRTADVGRKLLIERGEWNPESGG